LRPTAGPRNSFRTGLKAAVVCKYIVRGNCGGGVRGRLDYIVIFYKQIVIIAYVQVTDGGRLDSPVLSNTYIHAHTLTYTYVVHIYIIHTFIDIYLPTYIHT
jgi:hypothetical protein